MDDIIVMLTLQGEERKKACRKIDDIVEGWGLSLPDVDPDALHFGYNDFYNIGESEFNITNNIEEGYCGKFMFLFAGQTCPLHHHKIKHETFFIVKGKVDMELDGVNHILKQGDTLVIDQFKVHQFTALENTLVLESSKPDLVDDSIFEDQMINKIIFGKKVY